MNLTEKEILEKLVELELAVKSMPTANPKPNLVPLFGAIDALTSRLPSSTDPQLLHYLHKKSYEKARLQLLGKGYENAAGNCHGHR